MATSQSLSTWSTLALTSLLLQACIQWRTGNTARCGTDTTALISGLNDVQITQNPALGSLDNKTLPKNDILPDGTGWCSEELGMNIHDPYLEFNFITSTIILNHIEITGANGSYVKDIQIETDMYGNGNFEFVRDAQTNTAQILNTTLTKADGRENISLNGTLGLVARVVRIRPYSWSENPPCMRLELYGCQADPDSIVPPDTTSPSERLTNLVLRIALPIALVTLLTVVTIAVISVTCCWYIKNKADRSMKNAKSFDRGLDIESDRTIKHVRNELYQISERRNTNDMEQTINSTTEVITTSYQGGGPPQPYEAVVMSQTQEADNDKDSDAYYSPVNPNPPQYITHDGDHNASKRRYEVVGGSDTMDSHGYEKVSAEISQRHVRSGGKKEGMNNARAEMENCSLEVPKFRPTKQSDSQYMNVPPSPVDRGFGMSESYGPEPYRV